MLTLKDYQTNTLERLQAFLEDARFGNPAKSFETLRSEAAKDGWGGDYRSITGLEDVPYVCLRLPTGGGKTLLAAHTVHTATSAYLDRETPVVLWLVPTNTIRQQTLETIKNPRHPNREALTQAFGSQVLVLDIADFTQIRPQDIKSKAVIVVGTIATPRVKDTEIRKIYAHHEDLEPHFVNIPNTFPGLETIEEGADKGKIKYSFRNLLAIHRPIVIIDEAHNAASGLSFEVLQRLNPSCIVEFTATPAENSNVLHSVSASELKAAEMIKLPIVLTEHQTWQEAIAAAIQSREKLEGIAKRDRSFIRPIVLFQAQEKGNEITYDVLLNYLLEQEKIPREKIAVATGAQRELDGVNLLDPKNKIEYVITVEALKEGWDCPFAYVFCSVARIHSKKDVEQILGRVLRMPYAKRRVQEELNRAYAHVSSDTWQNSVGQLQDRMVSMGFEEQEADHNIIVQSAFTGMEAQSPQLPAIKLTLSAPPNLSNFTNDETARISTKDIGNGMVEVKVTGIPSPEFAEKLVLASPKPDRAIVTRTLEVYESQQTKSPSQKGESFEIPQLCLWVDGELEIAAKEWFLDEGGWSLTKYPAQLTEGEFSIQREAESFSIDIQGKQLVIKDLGRQLPLDLGDAVGEWTELTLSRNLDGKLSQIDIRQEVLLEFLRKTIHYLVTVRNIPLADLVRTRFVLEKALREKIKKYRQMALDDGYQKTLFKSKEKVETSYDYAFSFNPDVYPAQWFYKGRYKFNNHYYPMVGELKYKGEEFECAQALDRNRDIRCWVRNLSRQPEFSFKLPTSTDNFYPDFVALLNDGRILVVEYKGDDYVTNDDSREKRNLGELWEEKSKRKALFLMAVERDEQGRDVYKQIEDKVKGK